MDEDLNKNKEEQEIQPEKADKERTFNWLKYLGVTLAAFFGAFLAVYFVMDMAFHSFLRPPFPPMPPSHFDAGDIDDLIEQQEHMAQDFANFKPFAQPFVVNPVKVETFQDDDNYKIVIDLKPFQGNEKNIKLDIKSNRVKVSGDSKEKNKSSESQVSFSQNFVLPQKIDVNKVTKVKKGHKYIITLPIED